MHRLPAPWGRRLNRKQPVRFEFCGKTVTAYDGDTVTSAILGAPDQPDYHPEEKTQPSRNPLARFY